MALLAAQRITCAGLTSSSVAADAAGDSCHPSPTTWVEIGNESGGTVTIDFGSGICNFDHEHPLSVTVDDGDTVAVGPLDHRTVPLLGGLVAWTYSTATGVTVAVLEIDPQGWRLTGRDLQIFDGGVVGDEQFDVVDAGAPDSDHLYELTGATP